MSELHTFVVTVTSQAVSPWVNVAGDWLLCPVVLSYQWFV